MYSAMQVMAYLIVCQPNRGIENVLTKYGTAHIVITACDISL